MGELDGRRILLLIVGHLANAPRARKEAAALVRAGARVWVRGVWSDPARADEDRALAQSLGIDFEPVCDLRPGVGPATDRVRHALATRAWALRMRSPRLLGPGAPEMLRAARTLRCDLTIAHGEPGLWVVDRLARAGHRVGVDFEDWFSEDQLEHDRPAALRHWLRTLEHRLLRDAHHVTATTSAMAGALAEAAGVARVPAVVPNSFAFDPQVRPADATPALRFHWFSQTVGPGRGLETLAAALPLLHGDWQLTLRGALHGHAAWFDRLFGAAWGDRVRRVDTLPVDELPRAVAQHDVGLALEVPYCRNKDLTASNKLFDYLRGGLAVIATDTRGQHEAMSAGAPVGSIVPPADAQALARAMQSCIDDRAQAQQLRQNARAMARDTWDFARFEPVIVRSVTGALAS